MDRLNLFLQQFPVNASVIHTGTLTGSYKFPLAEHSTSSYGHLHVIRMGDFVLRPDKHSEICIDEPTVVYLPNAIRHELQSANTAGTREVLCATVQLGNIAHSQITSNLPEVMLLPLSGISALENTINLIFDEANADHCGKQIAQDNLVEYFLVLLLRALIERNAINIGILAGFADKRLSKILHAVQENPGKDWTLTTMASTACMSRSRFAEQFKQVLGITPHQFVTNWRVAAVQKRLSQGETFNQFAEELGYSHPAALVRAFQQQTGETPSSWAKQYAHP